MDDKRLVFRKIIAIVMSAFLTLVLLPVEVRANDETDDSTITESENITKDNVSEGIETEDDDLTENTNSTTTEEETVLEDESEINDVLYTQEYVSNDEPINDLAFIPVLLSESGDNEESTGLEAPNGEAVYNKLVSQIPNETMGGKAHPYGYGDSESSILKVNTGVQLYTQHAESSLGSYLKTYKSLNADRFSSDETTIFKTHENVFGASKKTDLEEYILDAGKLAYMQSVSFDPTGCGRNNYVAYIGMDRDNGDAHGQGYVNKLWVYNSETKKVSKTFSITSTTWEKDALNDGEFFARNFFSITAGDYDGDGKDTLVVFTAQDNDDENIKEFKVVFNTQAGASANANVDNSIEFKPVMNHQVILNPGYFENAAKSAQNTDPTKRLYCDLVSGDVNADGIDDLIAVSGSDSTKNTYLGVLFGDENGFNNNAKKCLGIYVKKQMSDIVSAGVDVGNIDGKGFNEIVVAGYKVVDNAKTLIRVVAAYNVNNAGTDLVGRSVNEEIALNYDSNVNTVFPNNRVWGRREVTCVAFDGQGNPEAVAVDDSVYSFTGDMFTQVHYSAPANLTTIIQPGICTSGTAASYEFNPANGIDANGKIAFEQLMYTQIFNDRASSSGNINTKATLVSVLGNAHYDSNGLLMPTSQYKKAYYLQLIPYSTGVGKQMMTNVLFNPVEVSEEDVVKVRLNNEVGTQVLKGTPEPIAVLQAAPWFSELGSSYVGSTSFGITETVGNGTSSGGSDFVGGGIAQSSQFPIGKQSLTITFKDSINYSCTKQTVNKYTSTFSAGPKDTVVVRLSPADLYIYDTKWGTGNWQPKSVGMTVMRPPLYAQITVDEYNALVGYMNANSESRVYPDGAQGTFTIDPPKLNNINKTSLYLGNEGKPEKYGVIDSTSLPDGWETISKGMYVLGYQGGTTTSNYSQEKSQNDSFSHSRSQDFRFEIQFGGADKVSNLGFWLGGFFTAGGSTSTGTVSIKGSGIQTSGTVKNLDISKDSSYENYGFEWSFGQTKIYSKQTSNQEDSQQVPVYGYALSNVKKGVQAPVITSVTKTETDQGVSCLVSWNSPSLSSGQYIDSYTLYGYDIDGNSRVIAAGMHETSYNYSPNGEEFVSFAVVAKVKEANIVFDSLASNRKSVFFLERGTSGADGKSAYQIAKDNGFTGTETEWLASLKGEPGQTGPQGEQGIQGIQGIEGPAGAKGDKGDQGISGESAYELAVKFGFTGTKAEWLASLKGDKGDKGDQGIPGENGINGIDGKDGVNGSDGKDGVNGQNGVNGLNGKNGQDGKSAYEIALEHGFVGSEAEWLDSLHGKDGKDYSGGTGSVSNMSHAYVDENNVLVIVLDDGRDVTIGEVENKTNDSSGMHLRLKKISPESGIKGFVKDWLPMLLALISLLWNLLDLLMILKLDKKLDDYFQINKSKAL